MQKAESFLGLHQLKGLGPKRLNLLQEMGISKLLDLLYHFPKRYQFQEKMAGWPEPPLPNYDLLLDATVTGIASVFRKKKLVIVRLPLVDELGNKITAIWFNQPYRKNQFPLGSKLWVMGCCNQKGSARSIQVKQCGLGIGEGGFKALYDAPKGISQNLIRQWLKETLLLFPEIYKEFWPDIWLNRFEVSSQEAFSQIHFPTSLEGLQKAQQRLILDETLILQMMQQAEPQLRNGLAQPSTREQDQRWQENLPFTLTSAQKKVIGEIRIDMAQSAPMARFVQGDVGSGKTVVAVAALQQATENGYQAVFLAPTELLARQHAESIRRLLPKDIPLYLLTGKSSRAERELAQATARSGELGVWVGTHALLTNSMEFKNLSLVVIDEQHRFGVMQRQKLLQNRLPVPDLLSLSATPIPRSLAMLLYGDMQASILDQLPPNRLPIKTVWLQEPTRVEKLIKFCLDEMEQEHAIYWVCPSIEQSEDEEEAEIPSVEERAEILKSIWPTNKWATLHGQMKTSERQEVMERFEAGQLSALLATTVIEVGVDQANATVMVIEGADRFGLAQLHQLRGRVGRGNLPSFCALITNDKISATAEQRIKALCDSQDGFYLAQLDLELRGPGEILGTNQSGFSDLLVFRWQVDENTLQCSRKCIEEWKAGKVQIPAEKWQVIVQRFSEKPTA
jgi:ATP-dependent DNA helicase RecG